MKEEPVKSPVNQNFFHPQTTDEVMNERVNEFKETDAWKLQPTTGKERTERLMAQQSCEILQMEEEYKAFRRMWQKKFRSMQERHKHEQLQMFQIGFDNQGYQLS